MSCRVRGNPAMRILFVMTCLPVFYAFVPVTHFLSNRHNVQNKPHFSFERKTKRRTEKYAVSDDTNLPSNIDSDDTSVDEIASALDSVCGTKPGNVIPPYKPQRRWLWRRWKGTVLRETLPTVAINMLVTLLICLSIRHLTQSPWALGTKPDPTNAVIARLGVFVQVWRYLMTLTTFVLTFFLGEAFLLWKQIYTIGRKVQGRLNDISILVATHAKRNKQGRYTQESQDLLNTTARHIRVFHVLMWASCARDYTSLLSQEGLNQMVKRDMLTREEADTLVNSKLPATQRHNALLEWIVICIQTARQKGLLEESAGQGFEQVFLDKICTLRGTYATIGDVMDGRMPLCYAHMVQVLVDGFLFCAPLALFAELGVWSVLSIGFLTFFYSGLLDLAKVFLDPLDNEDYSQESAVKIDLSVLIRETNDGSVRWKNGVETLPSTVLES